MFQPLMSGKRTFVVGLLIAAVLGVLLLATPVGAKIGIPQAETPSFVASHSPTPPSVINFQGVLTNPANGNLVSDNSYPLKFTVFDAATAGNNLWTETQSVTVAGGRFSVFLGSSNAFPANLFSGTPRYLEVEVVGEPGPMTPRQQFATVPYAFHAGTADSADSAETAGSAGATSRLGFSLTTVDSADAVGLYTSVTIGSDGLPFISYWDNSNVRLKVAHCGDVACSAGNTVTSVDSVGDVGRYSSVTIGSDGLPVIAYYRADVGHVKVIHCGNVLCNAGNTITTVAAGGDRPSLTIGRDGFPVISYRDLTYLDLNVVHCGNVLCSAGNLVTPVDSVGNVGEYSSITIVASGAPVVSYYDQSNGYLKVPHCGNAACASANTITTVDSAGVVGLYTSITVAPMACRSSATTTTPTTP